MARDDRPIWVAAAIDALQCNGSWTGRMHVHKHLFLLQELTPEQPPFEFELYNYGPYSFGLDREIADMELFGRVAAVYRRPGYGPSYRLTQEGQREARALSGTSRAAVNRVAERLGNRNSQSLELIATCIWAERREGISGDSAIIDRVRELKPHFAERQVADGLHEARELAARLQT